MILGYECVYLLQGLLRDIHGCGAIPLPPLAAVRPRLSRPVSSATRNSACLLLIVFLDFLFSFLRGYGLDFCSPNFRKERLGCGRNCDLAQQQSPSGDLVSINRPPGVIVLTDRCSFQREASERALCTGVGQDLCIHLPIRAGLSMPSNGPAAAEASPPTWKLLSSSFCIPFSFWMINTTSTASTPICRPQLPPEIVMNAGALQPFAVRQVATPLPPLPPKTKPPLTMCGMTATHFACSNTSSGIPLSGIPIISCSTVVALSRRSVAFSRAVPAQHSVPRPNIANTNMTFFIEQPLFSLPYA